MTSSTLFLLADGRFPAGGHAHSGGLEEAVASGRVVGAEDLGAFLAGRLATIGRVDAAFAGAAWVMATSPGDVAALEREVAARCPSPALRAASRAQGRGISRAATAIWGPGLPTISAGGLMYPLALGQAAHWAGLGLDDACLLGAQAAISGPAWAATRLLGLNPYQVAGCLAQLAGEVEATAAQASATTETAGRSLAELISCLPSASAPLVDIGAEGHAHWEVRLFAS